MPELPEVETVRQQLEGLIIGATVTNIEILSEKQVDNNDQFKSQVIGKTFGAIDRIGKLLIFSFKGELDLFLLGHLKMTGQLLVVKDKGGFSGGGHSFKPGLDITDLPNQHTRVIFYLDSGSTLYFNDLRKFGYLKTATRAEVEATKSRYGPEPISDDFDCDDFFKVLQRSSIPIKVILLDQKRIAGLGNIYVDEALWFSCIHPTRTSNTLTKKESDQLCFYAGKVMKDSIKLGGTTFRDFADTSGQDGNYRDLLRVFGRAGQECSRCKAEIVKIKFRGRGTHYCQNCQV